MIHLRDAHAADLAAINAVLHSATTAWDLPPRVRRLSLPALAYTPADFDFMRFVVAAIGNDTVGVSVVEPVRAADDSAACAGLHGLYVDRRFQGLGVGTRLLAEVFEWAAREGVGTLHLRAWRSSERFFTRHGFSPDARGQSRDRLDLSLQLAA